MSLDVTLYESTETKCECGKGVISKEEQVYTANITHNLNEMASNAGIYQALWRPEERSYEYAKDLIEVLTKGLDDLKNRPAYFSKFNSPNGWGMYEHFVPFVQNYLNACIEYPNATIYISR